jgi:hypothetical protein
MERHIILSVPDVIDQKGIKRGALTVLRVSKLQPMHICFQPNPDCPFFKNIVFIYKSIMEITFYCIFLNSFPLLF